MAAQILIFYQCAHSSPDLLSFLSLNQLQGAEIEVSGLFQIQAVGQNQEHGPEGNRQNRDVEIVKKMDHGDHP